MGITSRQLEYARASELRRNLNIAVLNAKVPVNEQLQKYSRVAGLVQLGSVRPCAPESPDAASSVTPRAPAFANSWLTLTALTKTREPAATPAPTLGWTEGEMSHWSSSYQA